MPESEESRLLDLLSRAHVRCPRCGYDLYGLRQAVCPECGLALSFAALLRRVSRRVPVRLPRHCLIALFLHPLLVIATALPWLLGGRIPDAAGCFACGGLWVVPLSWAGVWWVGSRSVTPEEHWKLSTLAFLLWLSVGVLAMTVLVVWSGGRW